MGNNTPNSKLAETAADQSLIDGLNNHCVGDPEFRGRRGNGTDEGHRNDTASATRHGQSRGVRQGNLANCGPGGP